MTEWTLDLIVPCGDAADTDDTTAPRNEVIRPPAPGDDQPYHDLVAGALIEDLQLDLVEWYP